MGLGDRHTDIHLYLSFAGGDLLCLSNIRGCLLLGSAIVVEEMGSHLELGYGLADARGKLDRHTLHQFWRRSIDSQCYYPLE